jgi:hypothetical protein
MITRARVLKLVKLMRRIAELWRQSRRGRRLVGRADVFTFQDASANRIAAPENVTLRTLFLGNEAVHQASAFRLLRVRHELHLDAGLVFKLLRNRPREDIIDARVNHDFRGMGMDREKRQ